MPKRSASATPRLQVTLRAVVQRIQRALDRRAAAGQGAALKLIGQEGRRSGGPARYALIDTRRQRVVEVSVNLERYGRTLNVLAPWEYMVEDVTKPRRKG